MHLKVKLNLEHAAALPDIPTGKEAGYKSLEFDGLVGLLGTREVPVAVRERIAADIREIAADPTVVARLSSTGQVINPGTPAEFAAALADQRATVAEIGKILDVKPPD